MFSLISQPAAISRTFLPGPTTAGHYQIELRCNVCHTPGMGVKQDSCLECHAQELKLAKDTHPASKFNDPSNAALLEVLDARKCITCHEEHVPERTHPMGLSLPEDYCYRCHDDITEVRPSHEGLGFETCASAGCHNFHDNRALYENFLASHFEEPSMLEKAMVPQRKTILNVPEKFISEPLKLEDHDAEGQINFDIHILEDWAASTHAAAGINCSDCHETQEGNWNEKVSTKQCQSCHTEEAKGFLAGKHGMRLAVDLEPMRPTDARLPMKAEAAHAELSCNSCHSAHSYSTPVAAVDSCMNCHEDQHTLAYLESTHFELWQSELAGETEPGTGVSCATCHMPRMETKSKGGKVAVVHNQNNNLRPNEKMIRSVCANCHGLEFTLDSLADPVLIKNNFSTSPDHTIKSAEMASKWLNRRKTKKNKGN